jgi:TonB family protein
MSLRVAIILLLLSGTVVGQGAVPIPLTGKNAAPVCRGKGKDAPDCVTPPRATYAPNPEYPERARKEHVRGSVTLQMVVGVDGLPRDIKVVRSNSYLDDAATGAVKTWRFSPATKGGQPVSVLISIDVTFNLG